MINLLWNRIVRLNIGKGFKFLLFRLMLEISAGLCGLVILAVREGTLSVPLEKIILFAGCPAAAALIAAVFFVLRHD